MVRSQESRNVVTRVQEYDEKLAAAKHVFTKLDQVLATDETFKEDKTTIKQARELMQLCGVVQASCKRTLPGQSRKDLVVSSMPRLPLKSKDLVKPLLSWFNSFA